VDGDGPPRRPEREMESGLEPLETLVCGPKMWTLEIPEGEGKMWEAEGERRGEKRRVHERDVPRHEERREGIRV